MEAAQYALEARVYRPELQQKAILWFAMDSKDPLAGRQLLISIQFHEHGSA